MDSSASTTGIELLCSSSGTVGPRDCQINTMRSSVLEKFNSEYSLTIDMADIEGLSVQEIYAPTSICFGCGPSNEDGLRIRSFRTTDGLEMEFTPNESHQAFPGMINGGIIGTLLDCHGNWTAAIALMDKAGDTEPPCTVTASYSIKLRRPTPLGSTLIVKGEVTEIGDDRANVKMSLSADGEVCATGTGLFVAVKEGHPAFHRWN